MLNPSDVYVSGGSDNLLACWTENVTKYDASSFYNWEQDNLPLHDLDERTHLLWEKAGHPTSALTGMSFIVSADATSSCNPLYFTTLSACINALPDVINYPILIEVASFGNLGGLNLSNKSFGPDGALEIINRNFGCQGAKSLDGTQAHLDNQVDTAAKYGQTSAITPGGTLALALAADANSPELPNLVYDIFRSRLLTKDSNDDFIYVSSGAISDSSGFEDARYVNPYVFSRRNDDRTLNRLTASLQSSVTPWAYNTNLKSVATLSSVPFDKATTDEMTTYDVSTVNRLTDGEIVWGDKTTTAGVSRAVNALVYFNYLDYIKVTDCGGPIYIRNFTVDANHSRDRGIEIVNSKVHLEKCSSSRSNSAGLYVGNSELDLVKGFVAYRNYKLVGGVRTGIPFTQKQHTYDSVSSYGAGIYAVNSTINLKSTYERDIKKSIEASSSDLYADFATLVTAAGYASGVTLPNPSTEDLYCMSRNDIGIHAVDSKIFGGLTELGGESANALFADATQVFSELNTEAGIKLENSVVDYSGRLLLDGNYFGMDATNSKVSVDSIAARYNQSTGLKLINSRFVYNKDLYARISHGTPADVQTYRQAQVACIDNGQDVLCDNTVIEPLYTSAMPSIYSMFYTSGAFGIDEISEKLLPSVHLKGGSDVDLIHAHMVRVPGTGKTYTAQYGLLTKVEDNSTLTVRGSSNYANVFLGPRDRLDSVNVAGMYTSNGSTIKIQGPTTIGRFGVDVLAEDNANIEITPHQNVNGGLLVSSFDLSNIANHTMVELHSTRSCLVANRNSNILMENVGDYQTFWENGAYGSSITDALNYADPNYKTYTSGGYVQFYPNANVDSTDVVDDPTNVTSPAYVFQSISNQPVTHNLIHTLSNNITDISTGGMCVRAVDNSLVEANNVHFPATWPITSSVAYDINGTDPLPGPTCSRLFIWNIADNSLLKATYLTVSAVHPRDAGYHGPSGVWGDASGAPSSTPDTSSISILDYYGKSEVNPFGKSSKENFGPFRLYFSIDPAAYSLVASGGGLELSGLAAQVFSQGYNFSGPLIASATDASSQYISLLQRDWDDDIHASGFYYASAMVASPETTKAVLDDSALNTFANAKHNMVGKSGLAKVVQGYYSTSAFGGESYNEYEYGQGLASINNFDLKKGN